MPMTDIVLDHRPKYDAVEQGDEADEAR